MNQRTIMIGAVLALIFSGVMLFKFFRAPSLPDSATQNLFEAYTQVTAQEISHMVGGHGDVVVLVWGAPSDDASTPGGSPDVRAICAALQKDGLHVLAKESVPPVRTEHGIAWTAENYRSVLDQYPQAAALISFVGSPQLSAENIRALPATRPKLFVVRLAEPETAQPLLEQGVLDGAVLPQDQPPAGGPPKTVRETFDKFYLFSTHK
jgi:hypothetical protein